MLIIWHKHNYRIPARITHSDLFLFAFSDNLISEDWFFAEGERFLSFWRCHRPRKRAALVMWCGWFKLRLEIRHATALTTGAKHWHRQKAVFYVFVSVPPVFIHRTEGRSWYRPILHNHNRPSPRLTPTPYRYHQATLNRSAIFACMVFRIMRHLRCLPMPMFLFSTWIFLSADFTYILHKLVLFHEKSLYLQKQDYQFH